jgi:ATP-dependent helicase/nuclease subunit B
MDAIAQNHRAAEVWRHWMQRIAAEIEAHGAHPSRTVVLLPFAQLMPLAARAWADHRPEGFAPRFQTTMNWASATPFEPAEHDLSFDTGRDLLTARTWLERAGLASQAELLASRLLESARQLAGPAAATLPAQRAAWAQRARAVLAASLEGAAALALEAALAQIALEWAAASSYAADVLFEDEVLSEVDLLVVIEGLQPDAIAQTVASLLGERARVWPWPLDGADGQLATQQASDAADEAERAAAAVVRHLQAGRGPVALAATDRVLTRRILALLYERQVPVRDETGWKLSTTRSAANLMGALRACAWNAATDEVLDWLKNSPAAGAGRVAALERRLRQLGLREWRSVAPGDFSESQALAQLHEQVEGWRAAMQRPRPLSSWLAAVRELLAACGQWSGMQRDAAGLHVLEALPLAPQAEAEFAAFPQAARRMDLHGFTAWVNEVLEAASFRPVPQGSEPVIVLPFGQLLGRGVAAVVLPGSDEVRLPAAPEPEGPWTAAQREVLGLPSREALAAAHRAAWEHALQTPYCDILWRAVDDNGEVLLPSPLVQSLLLDGAAHAAADPRETVAVAPHTGGAPRPAAALLPLAQLSASAYEDLRRCPYRFFAMRQLGLREADEIDEDLGKRDFGSWLHAVLRGFHEALHAAGELSREARVRVMDEQAHALLRRQRLDEGEFLPFLAGWPALRDGYLRWLEQHEASGARFAEAEGEHRSALGPVDLMGRVDRIDRLADGTALVMDYKTEAAQATRDRMKQPLEDTQLAFYAALVDEPQLRAAYLNISERGEVTMVDHADVLRARELLVAAMADDVQRIADGAPMPALGEGRACEYCAARGLCRKDFWIE